MSEDKKICRCRNVYYSEIKAAINEEASTIESVMTRTGAATCCGGCFSQLKKILLESK